MKDTSHLVALSERLGRELAALAASKSPLETEHREVWVRQIEREMADEYEFLGLPAHINMAAEISDDELFELLSA